jgi:glycosyltransferase involved in cell wall biosynthesis
MKIHFITNLPAPYRLACFGEIAHLSPGFFVTFERIKDPQRRWEATLRDGPFDYQVMAPGRLRRCIQWLAIGVAQKYFPIHGNYSTPGAVVAMMLHILLGRPYGLWSESTLRDWRPRSALKRRIKRMLFSRARVVFCPGKAAAAYAVSYGARRVEFAGNCIDTETFGADLAAAGAVRDGSPRLVYIGRLSPEKGIVTAIRALARLDDRAVLHLLGFGPEEDALRALAQENGFADRVRFVGYKEGVDLAREYAEAEIMILPSLSEPWGLVVNEAMQAGTVVVASRAVGCAPDLIEDGVTGFLFEPGDVDALAAVLQTALGNPAMRDRVRDAARERIRDFTPAIFARGLVDGVRAALGTTLRGN